MRIPMRVDYGVRALVELAQCDSDAPVQTAPDCQTAGNTRGLSGPSPYDPSQGRLYTKPPRSPRGHTLSRAAENIDLAQVMGALEGRGPLLDCLVEPDGCQLSDTCAQREVWSFFEEAVRDLLSDTTIASMARRQSELTAGSRVPNTTLAV